MSLDLLPTELLHQVASYITSLEALRALACVNRRFHAIFDPLLYKLDARLHPSAAIDWAAEHGRIDIIHTALSHGAGLPKTVREYKFRPSRKSLKRVPPRAHPLCVAVQNGHAEIVDFFIASGCDINMTGNLWVSLLSLAVIHNHPNILKLLLSLGATHDKHASRARSPIEHAASQGDMVAMEILLGTERPNWPFFRHTQNAFECAFNKGDSHMMQLILDSGRLDVNFRFARPPDQKSYTPLLWAVEREDIEHIKLFLNAGADPNFPFIERIEREPALVRAVRRKREDMVRLLLPKTDRPRRTLALACSIKWWASDTDTHIARILLESGTRPDFEEGDRTNLGAPLSHAPPGPIDDDPAVSPLILAIFRGQIDLVRLLVAHGADLLVDFLGPVEADPKWTIGAPLLLAVRLGHEDIAEFLRDQGASEASRMATRFDEWSQLYS